MPTFHVRRGGVTVVPAVTHARGRDRRRHRHHQHEGRRVRHRRAAARPATWSATRSTTRNPGYAEQDPQLILDAVLEVDQHRRGRAGRGRSPALSFSSAMHSLIGLDPDGDPLTPSMTWADSRSTAAGRTAAGGAVGAGPAPADRHAGAPDVAAAQAALVRASRSRSCFERVAHWVGHQGLRAAAALRRAGHRPLGRLGHRPAGHPHAGVGPRGAAARRHRPRSSSRSSSPPPPCCPSSPPQAPPRPACRRAPRWSSARATGRWRTSASARCTPAWWPARSAPAARCG